MGDGTDEGLLVKGKNCYNLIMNIQNATLEQLQEAVEKLPPEKLARFRAWFEEFAADAWDRQIEQDAKSGKLDKLVAESEEDFRAGRCREL